MRDHLPHASSPIRPRATTTVVTVWLLLSTGTSVQACEVDESGLSLDDAGPTLDVQSEPDVVVADGSAEVGVQDADADATVVVSPATVSSLQFWVRADDLIEAGTDAAVSVPLWKNDAPSGSARDVHALGLSPVATASASYGGHGVVTFAANDGLSNATWTLPLPFSVFIVGHSSVPATYSYFIDSSFGQRFSLLAEKPSADVLLYSSAANVVLPNGGVGTALGPAVIVAIVDVSSVALYVSSNTPTLVPISGNPMDGVMLGNYLGNDSPHSLGGSIVETALFSAALDSSTVSNLNAYASTTYGVTITN